MTVGSLLVVLLLHGVSMGEPPLAPAEKSAPAPQPPRERVATVLDSPVYLDQITPAEAPTQQRELTAPEYERWLRNQQATALVLRMAGRVLNDYAAREKLTPSDAEIDARVDEALRRRPPAPGKELDAAQTLAVQAFWLRASSHEWRTAKALYEKYGGRIGVSAFGGCTSLEGRNAVLKQYAAAGEIAFANVDWERLFWEHVRDARNWDAVLRPEQVADFFAVPPWERPR